MTGHSWQDLCWLDLTKIRQTQIQDVSRLVRRLLYQLSEAVLLAKTEQARALDRNRIGELQPMCVVHVKVADDKTSQISLA